MTTFSRSLRSRIVGCGGYLPERILTNEELSRQVDTSHEWIVQRIGIHQRHIADKDEKTSDLATAAAQRALHNAGIKAQDIDLIVVATTTPDKIFPSTAAIVQAKLGISSGVIAFDVQAVCSGFLFALATANNFLQLKQAKTALVIGAETMSRIIDWQDRQTCVIFGDGAGAVVLKAEESTRGILSTHLHTDGNFQDLLYVDPATGYIKMIGKEVYRHAVTKMESVVEEVIETNQILIDEIDWLVPHQANKRIIDATAERLHIPNNQVVVTIDRHGNTSAASIPLALAEAAEDNLLQPNQLILFQALGAGLTWGASLVRW